jgi:hypothetical protein
MVSRDEQQSRSLFRRSKVSVSRLEARHVWTLKACEWNMDIDAFLKWGNGSSSLPFFLDDHYGEPGPGKEKVPSCEAIGLLRIRLALFIDLPSSSA